MMFTQPSRDESTNNDMRAFPRSIVEIIFSIQPDVSFVGQAVRLIAHVFYVRPLAIIKGTLEELHAQDTKDYEKSTAYQNDVANRS